MQPEIQFSAGYIYLYILCINTARNPLAFIPTLHIHTCIHAGFIAALSDTTTRDRDQRELRGKAMECVSMIVDAVGNEVCTYVCLCVCVYIYIEIHAHIAKHMSTVCKCFVIHAPTATYIHTSTRTRIAGARP